MGRRRSIQPQPQPQAAQPDRLDRIGRRDQRAPLLDEQVHDALGAAAERLFARGQRISIGKDKDVRMAREMLGSGGGARARRDAGLIPADEDSSGDEDDTAVVEAGSGVDTRPEEVRPGLESFSSKYDRVMKGER